MKQVPTSFTFMCFSFVSMFSFEKHPLVTGTRPASPHGRALALTTLAADRAAAGPSLQGGSVIVRGPCFWSGLRIDG